MDVRGGISLIYSALADPSEKVPYMLKWESDLDIEWDLDTWNFQVAKVFKGILNVSLVEANLKVVTRWYLVPTRQIKLFPQSSPLCFRGCDLLGSHLHILWQCPKIRSFWNKVFNLIRTVTGAVLSQDPTIALLNKNIPNITKYKQRLIHFMLLGAKITIGHAWKSPSVSFQLAKQKITWIMIQEKTSSIILDKSESFKCIWEPWAQYIGTSL